MHRIALIEGEPQVASLIKQAMMSVGIEVDGFATLSEASIGIARARYKVLVLEGALPDGGDGLRFLKNLRTAADMTPCLLLTARDAVHERIDGLAGGADDCLAKPFVLEELTARVRALMRRPVVLASLTPHFGNIVVDPERSLLQCGEVSQSLSPTELQVMLCLVEAGGKFVRHKVLEHAAWGGSTAVTPNALDVAIHRLRKKTRLLSRSVRIINLRGCGYALHDTDLYLRG